VLLEQLGTSRKQLRERTGNRLSHAVPLGVLLASIPEVNRLLRDANPAHLASVLTRRALERSHVRLAQRIEADELARTLRPGSTPGREHACADRARQAVVGVDVDLASQQALERRHDRTVRGGPALEDHRTSNEPPRHHPVQVVARHRHRQPRAQVVDRRTGLLRTHELRVHEHCALGPEVTRGLRAKRSLSELAHDGHAQPTRLLLEKRPRTRGANLVHLEVREVPVPNRDELRILAADLEDRVRVRNELHGGHHLGRDLVVHHVRAEHRRGQMPSTARRPHPQHPQPVPKPRPHRLHPLHQHVARTPSGGEVLAVQHLEGRRQDDDVRGHGADVDP
jgi:hypothetical protein